MSVTSGGGFVERVVRACDRIESSLNEGKEAPTVAAALATELFESVLGYGGDDYDRSGAVVRFRDTTGEPAVVLAAAGRGADAEAVVDPAFAAAAGTPGTRFVVAATPDRLLVFECVSGESDAETRTIRGITARQQADVAMAELVASGRRGSLAETLDPAQQLGVAKLRVLRAGEVTALGGTGRGSEESETAPASDSGSTSASSSPSTPTTEPPTPADETPAPADETPVPADETPAPADETPVTTETNARNSTAEPASGGHSETGDTNRRSLETEAGFGTLVGTLRDCLDEVLLPAVETAFDDVHPQIEELAADAEPLQRAVETAMESEADETAAGPARAAMLAHEAEFAAARQLRASYGTWVRGARRTGFTPSENRRAFQRVTAFALLDELLLTRIAEGQGLCPRTITGDSPDALRRVWDECHLDRDASDPTEIAIEARAEAFQRRAPDTAAWARGHDTVAAALSDVIGYLDQFAFGGSPARLASAYDTLLETVALPEIDIEEDRRPAEVLNRVLSDDGARGAAAALLDPACGDGRYLLTAVERLRDQLGDASATARVQAIRGAVTGVDPDPLAVRVTESRLLLRLLSDLRAAQLESETFSLSPLRVFRTDPLLRDGDDGRPPAPDAFAGRSYDAVIGQFPTVLRRDVPDGPAAEAYADYEAAYYTYDLSALYVERAREWLAPGGTLAAVVAGRFRTTRFGTKLRERLPGWYDLAELREVPGDAPGGPTLLLVGERREPTETPAAERPAVSDSVAVADGIDATGHEVVQARLTGEEWCFDSEPCAEADPEPEGMAD
jgi:hypothetical protein